MRQVITSTLGPMEASSMSERDTVADLLEERSRLLAIGYRMLGSRADAEDAVQDTYIRWYRMTESERHGINTPAAWLTTTMTRVCLNVLASARHRRETYVGQWLPEPVASDSPLAMTRTSPTQQDPAEHAMRADELTMALMVMLEALTPAERVAFVLHDVFGYTFDEVATIVGRTSQACRKLASSARRHIEEERRRGATVDQHRLVVESFVSACATGDVGALVQRLDPDAVATSDGGGHVRAALRPIVGADRVARFLLGGLNKSSDLVASVDEGDGETRLVFRRGDEVVAVASFEVVSDRISKVWLVMNPEKLKTWHEQTEPEPHTLGSRPVNET